MFYSDIVNVVLFQRNYMGPHTVNAASRNTQDLKQNAVMLFGDLYGINFFTLKFYMLNYISKTYPNTETCQLKMHLSLNISTIFSNSLFTWFQCENEKTIGKDDTAMNPTPVD